MLAGVSFVIVTETGEITGGTFKGIVDNEEGTISYGTFEGKVPSPAAYSPMR